MLLCLKLVEHHINRRRFSYLVNAIFQQSKLKLVYDIKYFYLLPTYEIPVQLRMLKQVKTIFVNGEVYDDLKFKIESTIGIDSHFEEVKLVPPNYDMHLQMWDTVSLGKISKIFRIFSVLGQFITFIIIPQVLYFIFIPQVFYFTK